METHQDNNKTFVWYSYVSLSFPKPNQTTWITTADIKQDNLYPVWVIELCIGYLSYLYLLHTNDTR